MMKIKIIKIGGNAVKNSSAELCAFIKKSLNEKIPVVVVHGGGPEVSMWLEKMGIKPRFVEGVRYTDGKTLEVAVSILAGKMNKEVVSLLLKNKIPAIGLAGVDGKMVLCRRLTELGFVGEPVKIDRKVIEGLARRRRGSGGFVPVISSIGLDIKGGGFLNINADVLADFLARSFKACQLVYVTDVPGVLDASGKVIEKITPRSVVSLIKSGTIKGGMVPKIRSALASVKRGVKEVVITDLKSAGTVVTED